MDNKTCLITGATSGIGLEMAKAFVEKGDNVIIIGRNRDKCHKTINSLREINNQVKTDYFIADLASLSEVRALAINIHKNYQKIDVLVNNAGAYFMKRLESEDGLEMTFALNYLSPFLLTHLLMDLLENSSNAKIINVSSDAHKNGTINLQDLQSKNNHNGYKAYAQSKLALNLFTFELARQKNAKICVNAFHPGFVATNFGKNNGLIRFLLRRLIKRKSLPPALGAETGLFLAEIDHITGEYFMNKKPARAAELCYDKELAAQLWQKSLKLVNL